MKKINLFLVIIFLMALYSTNVQAESNHVATRLDAVRSLMVKLRSHPDFEQVTYIGDFEHLYDIE